eukprot:9074456-Pyramimonas_sp.AAC.2
MPTGRTNQMRGDTRRYLFAGAMRGVILRAVQPMQALDEQLGRDSPRLELRHPLLQTLDAGVYIYLVLCCTVLRLHCTVLHCTVTYLDAGVHVLRVGGHLRPAPEPTVIERP